MRYTSLYVLLTYSLSQ